MQMKRISILGSTGSIGRQTLDVVSAHPDKFQVAALAGGSNVELVAEQVAKFNPYVVSVATESGARLLCDALKSRRALASEMRSPTPGGRRSPTPEVLFGAQGMERVATHPDAEIVVSAAVGVVGLPVLTPSGGPFRKLPLAKFSKITPKQALAHPNWKMGQRITIDSATMMNKGFEVIEAKWLFGVGLEKIHVVSHPQSTIHSMVECVDGSIRAQLGPTDMRMPIQYALTYPERVASNYCALDWSALKKLDFEEVPAKKFPCLTLAKEAMRKGGLSPCALNAADEIAVEAFLKKRLSFLGIAAVIEKVLEKMPCASMTTIEDVLQADSEARRLASIEVDRRGN